MSSPSRCRLRLCPLAAALLIVACAGLHPADLALERGEVALDSGHPADAADAYYEALTYRPGDPRGRLGLARAHLAQGDGEAALMVLTPLSQSHPEFFRENAQPDLRSALYRAADLRLRRGDPAQSLRFLERLEDLDPDHDGLRELEQQALIAEAARLRVLGHPGDAEPLLVRAVGLESVDAEALAGLAEALLEAGRLDLAVSVLSDGRRAHPGSARLRVLMDRALDIRYPDAPLTQDDAGSQDAAPPQEGAASQEGAGR